MDVGSTVEFVKILWFGVNMFKNVFFQELLKLAFAFDIL